MSRCLRWLLGVRSALLRLSRSSAIAGAGRAMLSILGELVVENGDLVAERGGGVEGLLYRHKH